MTGNWWNAEREQQVRELWPTHSASEIGAKIGASRNAVIGKASRLGLTGGKPKPIQTRKPSADPKTVRARALRRARAAGISPPPLPKREPATTAPPPPVDSKRVPLIELTYRSCRWPLGDPQDDDFCFCGADRESLAVNRPYCAGHEVLAYRPTTGLILKKRRGML